MILYGEAIIFYSVIFVQADLVNSEVDTVSAIVYGNADCDMFVVLLEDCQASVQFLNRSSAPHARV